MKVKIHGITYGDELFVRSREKAYESLKKFTNNAYCFTEKDLAPFKENISSKICYTGARGGGYWIFKPIFLKQILNSIPDGEAVLWMDAGVECVESIEILTDIASTNRGFCLFQQIHKNSTYTKRDCFYYMDADNSVFYNARHCDASVQLYIKNEETVKFVEDYLMYCSDYRVVTDSANECGLPNIDGFVDHRHDQSILTNLRTRYNLNSFILASQWYNEWNSNHKQSFLNEQELYHSNRYNTLFNHHRNRF